MEKGKKALATNANDKSGAKMKENELTPFFVITPLRLRIMKRY